MIRHYLNYISSGHGRVEINEPEGFGGADFVILQDDDRKGRDIAYAAGKQLTIRQRLDHSFEIFKYNYEYYGYEAVIYYEISFVDDEIIRVGQISSVLTDRVTYFKFTVIEVSENMILKRRFDVKTNLFSNTTLDGADIEPARIHNVLMKAKPVFQQSRWTTPAAGGSQVSVAGIGGEGNNVVRRFNFASLVQQSDLQDTLSYIPGVGDGDSFGYIEAKENLRDIIINISNLSYSLSGTGDGEGYFSFRRFIGTDNEFPTGVVGGDRVGNVSNIIYNNDSYSAEGLSDEVTIPFLNRGQKIYLWFVTQTTVATNDTTFGFVTNILSLDIKITATSIAYNTIVPMVRLIDAMRYNVRSSANLPISAPRWEAGGEFYDQFITTQALMRQLGKPFYLSTKEIVEDYLKEVNGDYQLQEDGTVFFGAADENGDDFYRPYEMANFTLNTQAIEFGQPAQIDEFEESTNPRFAVNKFRFAYNTYASQKETEQENTYDDVHGEAEWLLKNYQEENTKEAKVGFVRSAFSIEEARRKAYNLSDTAATQDDDKKYIVDIVALKDVDRYFTESSNLQHGSMDGDKLILKNDGSFSWLLLGIIGNTPFTIYNGDNAGDYWVVEISENSLTLQGSSPAENILEQSTLYRYYVHPFATELTCRTNEGFDLIENLADGTTYPNLMYTVKRNIIKRYGSYLATCVLFAQNKEISNTFYKNNPLALTQVSGKDPIIEGNSFIPVKPILTHSLIRLTILMSLQDFFNLRSLVRSQNGYIRTFDTNGLPLKGFIKQAKWTFDNNNRYAPEDFIGKAECILEEKYEPFYMTIFGVNGDPILINDEVMPSHFDYEIDGYGKLHIFDATGKLMHVPVPYNRVKVNNSGPATSTQELAQWLAILKA